MIQPHSDDPNVAAAAHAALKVVQGVLGELPKATTFDYGGHSMHIGDYGVCERCTSPIAEAQQASVKLLEKAGTLEDDVVKEHVQLAAQLLRLEAEAAQIRAELHNGHGSEPILNALLGFIYDRKIQDDYHHSHGGGS
jgi:propanediol dehydratase small subunit